MNWLIGLVGFGFVCTVTPGPNNLLLWASGAAFGWRRSWPHVLGTAVGVGALGLAVAAGLGVLITEVPLVGLAMKVGGSAYLLYLAWQVAGAGALRRTAVARPMGIRQAAIFQLVNPKVWIFALGAVSTFRPPDAPLILGSLLVAAIMAAVSIPSSAVWAMAGDLVDRLIANDRTRRAVSLGMAILIAATVVLVWI